MRRIQLGIVGSLLSVSLVSCGDLNYSISSNVHAVIPDEIYYQTVGHCEDGSLSFKVLGAAGTQLWTDPGAVLTGQSELFMNRDGTFSVRYREFTFSSNVFDTLYSDVYTLNENNGEIHFSNLGVGKISSARGRYYLDLQYSVNINSTMLAGQKARFRIMKSRRGLNTDVVEYCNY